MIHEVDLLAHFETWENEGPLESDLNFMPKAGSQTGPQP